MRAEAYSLTDKAQKNLTAHLNGVLEEKTGTVLAFPFVEAMSVILIAPGVNRLRIKITDGSRSYVFQCATRLFMQDLVGAAHVGEERIGQLFTFNVSSRLVTLPVAA